MHLPNNFVNMSCVWHLGLLALLILCSPFDALGQVAPCGHQCWEEHRHHHSRLQKETDQTSSQEWSRLHWHQWHHRVWHQVPGRRCFPGKAVSASSYPTYCCQCQAEVPLTQCLACLMLPRRNVEVRETRVEVEIFWGGSLSCSTRCWCRYLGGRLLLPLNNFVDHGGRSDKSGN